MTTDDLVIAAIVPCHNEETAVAAVIRDLLTAVPGMDVYVYDNRSTDSTAELAPPRARGPVRGRQGQGNVVRRAFGDIEADVYLLIDGDDTYDAAAAPEMIETLLDGPYDHILGVRRKQTRFRVPAGPRAGNKAFNKLVSGSSACPSTTCSAATGSSPAASSIVPGRLAGIRDRDRADGAQR